MGTKSPKASNIIITALLVFQLTGCGTILYPERRGQMAGHLDAGVVILDAIGLIFFIIPGVIAFAVDFSNGTIYLPARPVIIEHSVELRQIKFDPQHTSIAQIEKIIKDQTGYAVKLTQGNMRVTRLNSINDMMTYFAQAQKDEQEDRLAYVR
jgi:hypothetical protein